MSQTVAQLQRKVKKPLIEKKRRERINKCLRELKKLVLDATDGDSSRLSAKLEKAEILEMTVAYVTQLRGAKYCLLSSDVTAGAPRRRTQAKVRDDLQTCDSSSAEYRAGFTECLLHVQRFLADQATGTSAEVGSEVALPQLLVDHLRQFVVNARPPKDNGRVVRSLPPSPDTTLGTLPSVDAQSLPPLPSTSPAVTARPIVPRSSALTAGQASSSLGYHQSLFLMPSPSDALRRNQFTDDVEMIQQSPTSDYELRRLPSGIFVVPPAIIQPSSAASYLLFSPLISTSASSDCSSPTGANAAATRLQPASPGDADHDVWRPWRPETSTCSRCSDVSDTSSTL